MKGNVGKQLGNIDKERLIGWNGLILSSAVISITTLEGVSPDQIIQVCGLQTIQANIYIYIYIQAPGKQFSIAQMLYNSEIA